MDDLNAQVWAVDALGALAHETRLSVFRMLVKAGPEGMIAGAIAEHQCVPPSTMSHHLATLERAGLVQSERESRLIHYRADYPGMRRLLLFLMQDCCQGAGPCDEKGNRIPARWPRGVSDASTSFCISTSCTARSTGSSTAMKCARVTPTLLRFGHTPP